MAGPLLYQKRLLAIKVEATPGTAPSFSDADGNNNFFNGTIQSQIEMTERDRQLYFGNMKSIPGALLGVAKFVTDMYGGASDPFWLSAQMPACGFSGSAGVYTPLTGVPGATLKTVTIYSYQAGKRKGIRGAVGNPVFHFDSGKRIWIEWTFMGIWIPPTDTAALAPTWPTTTPLSFKSASFAIASWAPRISSLTIDMGNELTILPDANDASGCAYGVITNRKPTVTIDPEAGLVATNDTYGQFLAGTEQALTLLSGSTGNKIKIDAPKLQIINPQEDNRGDIEVDTLNCQLNSSAGDDEITFTCT